MSSLVQHIKDVAKGKAKLTKRRSSRWPALRKAFLEANPTCAACGSTSDLEVHHIKPYHQNPELELDPSNLIVLCDKPGPDNHHLTVGHLGSFRKANPDVVDDAADMLKFSRKPRV
jgi:5-methylcytosine-specific restriction endonuclease McrA